MSTQNTEFEFRRSIGDHGPDSARVSDRAVRAVSTSELFQQGEHEIAIRHGDAVYSLKITRQDRLVLNK